MPKTNDPAPPRAIEETVAKKPVWLAVHGTVQYEYYRRSRIDTPFQQDAFWQHTERIYLNAWVADKYPFRIGFTARQNNSPWFRNFGDLNLQFDGAAYLQRARQRLIAELESRYKKIPGLTELEAEIATKRLQLKKRQDQKASPANLQKLIEEKERLLSKKQRPPAITSAVPDFDSLAPKRFKFPAGKVAPPAGLERAADKAGENLDSLAAAVRRLEGRRDSLLASASRAMATATRRINSARTLVEVSRAGDAAGLAGSKPSGLARQLSYLKTVSVGRSIVNYTELTAQNIAVTGINIEYENRVYAAFAAGTIDYRYRDFFHRNTGPHGQYLTLGRFGFKNTENTAFIFTVYQGRKNRSDFALSDTVNNSVPVFGYSLQAIFRKDARTGITLEYAKSTKPSPGSAAARSQEALVKFRDRSNNGFHAKGETEIAATGTRLSGFYRSTGESFQSFSLFGYNSHQKAWQARVDQELLNRKILLSAALRQNDFSNPFAEKTYSASTVFKSLQLQVRFPKYPALALGYYPGTQLYLIDKEHIQESAFYILNGTLTHAYHLGRLSTSTLALFNRYSTKASDSGFVAYKGDQYVLTQTFFLGRLQLQGGYARTVQPGLVYGTCDASAEWNPRKAVRVGGGLKYSRTREGLSYWGQSGMASVETARWGGLRVLYEKAFLPTLKNGLGPVETGSIVWYKTF